MRQNLAQADEAAGIKGASTIGVEAERRRANLSIVTTGTSTGGRPRTGDGRSGNNMRYRFEDFVLDPDRRELTRGPEHIATGPQVFDLLLYLLENRTHVVTKDDLLDRIWKGRAVSDSTLASHINAARKAICDSGQEQRLIRTIARKGFRFVGDVTEGPPPGGLLPATARCPSIVVLPFVNLSGDAARDNVIDGVVEDIISALSRMKWRVVIAYSADKARAGAALGARRSNARDASPLTASPLARARCARIRPAGVYTGRRRHGHECRTSLGLTRDNVVDRMR